MSSEKLDAIAAGHLCLDLIPRFLDRDSTRISEIFRPGSLIQTGRMLFSTGGAVSNTGIAMKIFGLRVGYMAKVGNDLIGQIIIRELEKHGRTDGIRRAENEASSYTVVLAPAGIDRIFLHCPGPNDTFCASDINYEIVKQARLFHFGYPALMKTLHLGRGEILMEIFKAAKEAGAATSLDLAMPDPNASSGKADWRSILTNTLPYVDIFLPSIEEAFFCMRPEIYRTRKSAYPGEDLIEHIRPGEYSELGQEFITMGCKMVALKAGPYGWYFRTGPVQGLKDMGRLKLKNLSDWDDRELWSPSFHIDRIASSTGAGDSSIAGFLTAILRGHSLSECLERANSAGRQNLTAMDALSGLKSWEEVERQIPQLRVNDLVHLRETDWRWESGTRQWQR